MNADTAIAEMHAEQALHSAEKHLAALREVVEWSPDDMLPTHIGSLEVLIWAAIARVNRLRHTLGISNGDLA